MNVCVLGYGRVWSTRPSGPGRAAAHFNTTGVMAHGIPKTRSHIYGYVRIDECLGFHPGLAAQTIHGVFGADGMTVWNGCRKLYLRTCLPKGTVPDRYLVRVCESEVWLYQSDALLVVQRRGGNLL